MKQYKCSRCGYTEARDDFVTAVNCLQCGSWMFELVLTDNSVSKLSAEVVVKNALSYKVIECIAALWSGWEGDSHLLILEETTSKERYAIYSNKEKRAGDVIEYSENAWVLPKEIEDIIVSYKWHITETERALALLKVVP